MIVQAWQFLQKCAIVVGAAIACGIIGATIPLLFDRDVNGVAGAYLFGTVGLIVGAIVGIIIVRRRFD